MDCHTLLKIPEQLQIVSQAIKMHAHACIESNGRDTLNIVIIKNYK